MEPGTKLGPYEIKDPLGKGGMGEVWLAEDTRLGRKVALKFLPADVANDSLAVKRLMREARTAAALDHPYICKIYEIIEADGRHFIAMEYVRGRTLADRLREGELSLAEALRYASEILEALHVAHDRGIVHRDIKPHNVILTEDGHVKVMDFGLATQPVTGNESLGDSEALTRLTRDGTTPGTPAYMAPEQLREEELDARTDLFSFGVMLYEMLVGKHPFRQPTAAQTAGAILTDEPPLAAELRPELPPQLCVLLQDLLAKEPSRRIGSAAEALEVIEGVRSTVGPPTLGDVFQFLRRPSVVAAVVLVLIGVAALATWRYRASQRQAAALDSLPRIEQLSDAGSYAEAYDLAVRAESVLGDHPRLRELWPEVADRLTVHSEPSGARVELQRFVPGTDEQPPPFLAGTTPLDRLRIARASHRMVVSKEGFLPLERMISSEDEWVSSEREPIEVTVELADLGTAPEGMVFVPGGPYSLVASHVQSDEEVGLADYFIDRYEVSNEQFRQFILSGGYTDRSYWEGPFVDGGITLSFEEGMRRLRDRSGLPGPRGWVDQRFPDGRGDHPVTGVSWHEAAAYCAYSGKRLPTLYEWEKAAVSGRRHATGVFMPWGVRSFEEVEPLRANFLGHDTEPVDAFPFGVSPYGAYNMAGNVAEWCLNPRADGYVVAGGSWADPFYVFIGGGGSMPPFAATDTVGFRCASAVNAEPEVQGVEPIGHEPEIMRIPPVDDAEYRSFLSHYRYDHGPRDAELIERVDSEDWIREELSISYGADDILAYLYLPKRAEPPFQTIFYGVSRGPFVGTRVSTEAEAILGPQLRAGRAVFAVAPKGTVERPWPGFAEPPPGVDQIETVAFRDEWLLFVREYRIALDYLVDREDIDAEAITYLGVSLGAQMGILLPAVEERFAAVVLIGTGINQRFAEILPEVNPINFAPRIHPPKLVVNGRHDQHFPVRTALERLAELLSEPKEVEIVDGGHVPPSEARSPVINGWLDDTLGPVSR